MPSKIKSKLLIVTIFCATLTILFLIAPATAEMYSLILLGVSLIMATLAGFNARETVKLQYKVSSFISLAVFVFLGIFASVMNMSVGGMGLYVAIICGIATIRALALLMGEYK